MQRFLGKLHLSTELTPRLLEAQDVHIGLGGSFNELDRLGVQGIPLGRHWSCGLCGNRILYGGHLKDRRDAHKLAHLIDTQPGGHKYSTA